MSDTSIPNPEGNITFDDVLRRTAEHFHVRPSDLGRTGRDPYYQLKVAAVVASHLGFSPRSIVERIVVRRKAAEALHPSRQDMAVPVSSILRAILPDTPVPPLHEEQPVTVTEIVQAVADYFQASAREILSDSRSSRIISMRHIAIGMTRRLTTLSLPNIGKQFERDHTTIHHAVHMAAMPHLAYFARDIRRLYLSRTYGKRERGRVERGSYLRKLNAKVTSDGELFLTSQSLRAGIAFFFGIDKDNLAGNQKVSKKIARTATLVYDYLAARLLVSDNMTMEQAAALRDKTQYAADADPTTLRIAKIMEQQIRVHFINAVSAKVSKTAPVRALHLAKDAPSFPVSQL